MKNACSHPIETTNPGLANFHFYPRLRFYIMERDEYSIYSHTYHQIAGISIYMVSSQVQLSQFRQRMKCFRFNFLYLVIAQI